MQLAHAHYPRLTGNDAERICRPFLQRDSVSDPVGNGTPLYQRIHPIVEIMCALVGVGSGRFDSNDKPTSDMRDSSKIAPFVRAQRGRNRNRLFPCCSRDTATTRPVVLVADGNRIDAAIADLWRRGQMSFDTKQIILIPICRIQHPNGPNNPQTRGPRAPYKTNRTDWR